jgi:hypothetical protein
MLIGGLEMDYLKKSILTIGLVGTFASSAAIAYAAPISFEYATTTISYNSEKQKWEDAAYTEGSNGTQYSRTYTEIYAEGVKRDYKNSGKIAGKSSSASAYVAIGYDDYEALSWHRIWWTSNDADSIATESRDAF